MVSPKATRDRFLVPGGDGKPEGDGKPAGDRDRLPEGVTH